MVREALLDMFQSLHQIQGEAAAGEFMEVLRTVADEGLLIDDDAIYDDPTPRPPRASAADIPESVAAVGLGAAGVSTAPSRSGRDVCPVGCGPFTAGAYGGLGRHVTFVLRAT